MAESSQLSATLRVPLRSTLPKIRSPHRDEGKCYAPSPYPCLGLFGVAESSQLSATLRVPLRSTLPKIRSPHKGEGKCYAPSPHPLPLCVGGEHFAALDDKLVEKIRRVRCTIAPFYYIFTCKYNCSTDFLFHAQ